VRHRTKVTKGPGSRTAGLAMPFELIESAHTRWRTVNSSETNSSSDPTDQEMISKSHDTQIHRYR